ncbi:MAG: hypothetical protein OEV06_03955 [Anaerolineae bacterium]|nr:hypothetical protein [Anaerolineae bacterium]
MNPTSITSVNRLPEEEKRAIYARLIPEGMHERFEWRDGFKDEAGNELLQINAPDGANTVEMWLYHEDGFEDAVLYGHLVDTLNDQIHILLYIMNDPESPRFDVDRMPDGTMTKFGTLQRHLAAEQAAMEAGLMPGQVRRGLGMGTEGKEAFEQFVGSLGHDVYFAEPLYYHNAVIFERYGFAYQEGRKLMEHIQEGFSEGGELREKLDGSDFRHEEAADSIRLRSWAVHDGILGEAFTDVTMYKKIGKEAGMNTSLDTRW